MTDDHDQPPTVRLSELFQPQPKRPLRAPGRAAEDALADQADAALAAVPDDTPAVVAAVVPPGRQLRRKPARPAATAAKKGRPVAPLDRRQMGVITRLIGVREKLDAIEKMHAAAVRERDKLIVKGANMDIARAEMGRALGMTPSRVFQVLRELDWTPEDGQ